MGRILAIDYGIKRTGIAVTDPLKLIASGLTTVPTTDLMAFLDTYVQSEEVERIVVGAPKRMGGEASDLEGSIATFLLALGKHFPGLPVSRQDERFTSKIAAQSLLEGGMKKKKRRDKALLDEVSATLILQSYLSKNE